MEKEQKRTIDRISTEYLQLVTNFRFAIKRGKKSAKNHSSLHGSIKSSLPVGCTPKDYFV
jgi:hypothetical protein